MTAAIVTFNFEQSEVREVTDQDGNPWFVLRDLLAAMGSSTKRQDAIDSVIQVFGDGGVKDLPIVDSLGRNQTAVIVSEGAATFLISRSNTERGQRLNRWLFEQVLPAIRKTGSYSLPKAPPAPPMLQTKDQLLAELQRAAWRRTSGTHNLQQCEVEKRLREFGITDRAQIGRTCAMEAELLNETILGLNSRKFRQWYDVPRPNRQHMPAIVLSAFADLEEQNVIQMRLHQDFSHRAPYLESYFSLRYPQILQYRNEQLSVIHKRQATKDYNLFPVAPLESPLLRVPDALLLRLGYVEPAAGSV